MLERYTDKSVSWVDLSTPTKDEAREVMEEYNIPPELMGDFTMPVPRSEATEKDGTIKITLDFPVVKRTDVESAHEIKFLIQKHVLITARYEDITALYKFGKEFEVLAILHRPNRETNGGHLFVALMDALYKSLSAKLDYIDSRLVFIEQEIFAGHEHEMVFEISKVSQRLITFRQTLFSHKEILLEAAPMLSAMFDESFTTNLEELRSHYRHLMRRVSAISDLLEELRKTNDSLVTTKQNEIMKTLTIMAFIMFPLTLMSSVFGMNTDTLPIVGREGDFWIILGMMGIATVGFFGFFRYKRWI